VVNFILKCWAVGHKSELVKEWMLDGNVKKDLKLVKRREVHSTADQKKVSWRRSRVLI
jgi:hypothetical protein